MENLENKSKLIDIINFDKVNVLLENFNNATGFVTAILDDEGNVLSKSGWREICTEFHRENTESAKICTQSDLLLSGKLAEGQNYHCHNCLNGLVDAAVPIIINDEFVGNLFTGQFFLEKPDRKFFQKQALKYGFEEKAYLDALDKVPIVSESQVNQVMKFLLSMTELISEMTLQSFEQKRLNKFIENSEEKYRGLYNSIRDAILVADINRNIIDCNPAFYSLFGYTKEEIIGKQTVYVYENETEFKKLGEALKASVGDKPFLKTVNYKKKSGLIFPGETNVFYLKNDKGEVSGFIGLIRDITEQKKSNEKLTEEKNKAQQYLDIANVILVSVDSEGIVKLINSKGCEILGYSKEEIIRQNWFDNFLPERYRAEVKEVAKKVLAGEMESVKYYENEILTKTGDEKLIAWHNAVIKDDNGKVIGTLSSGEDITKRKIAEEELEKYRKHLEELVEERTKEVDEKNKKLADQMNVFVGREMKIRELQNKIKVLQGK